MVDIPLIPAIVLMWWEHTNPPLNKAEFSKFKSNHERWLAEQQLGGAAVWKIEYEVKRWKACRQNDGSWPKLLAEYNAA